MKQKLTNLAVGELVAVVVFWIDFYESCDERHRLSRYGNDYIATLCIKL